jgi:Uncharacterized conserved protein
MEFIYLIIALIFLVAIASSLSKLAKRKNRFTHYSEEVEKAAANLDVQLEKQYDSINSIFALIKNYDQKEYDFIKDITALRQKNISIFEKSSRLDAALQRVYTITDHTPQITATPMYNDLIREIRKEASETAEAKKRYNQAVTSYNKRIQMVPYSYFSKMWGFEKKPLFQTSTQSVEKHKIKTETEVYDAKSMFK